MMKTPPRVHALLHVPFEGLGAIRPWLEARGYSLSETHLYLGEPPPALTDFDWLIVMGGPMSVHDEQEHPWLVNEKTLLKEAIAMDKTLLGICLGAQLIAEASGGSVVAGEPEIGWWPLYINPTAENDRFAFDQLKAFHWHGEQIQLPPRAQRLASSQCCETQAFQIGERIIGLQFHLETTPRSARLLVENAAEDLTELPYVQNAQLILAAENDDYQALDRALQKVLNHLAKTIDPARTATQ